MASNEATADIYELEELAIQPGTYFNPQTEVVLIVDDSVSIDQDIFDTGDYEGTDWVRVSEEVPVDEPALERSLEQFQTRYHAGGIGSASTTALDLDDAEVDDEPDDDGPDPDPDPED